jgi:hypothetical protein
MKDKFTDEVRRNNFTLRQYTEIVEKKAKHKERDRILKYIKKRTENWEVISKSCKFCDRMDKLLYDLLHNLKELIENE